MRVDESLFYLAERGLNDVINSLTLAKNSAQAPYPPEFKYKAEIEGVKADFDSVANGMFALIAREEEVKRALIEVGMLTEKTGPLKLISSTQMSGYSYDINSYEGRVNYIYDQLRNLYGFTEQGAKAVIANFSVEAEHFLPDQEEYGGGGGYGLAQWTGTRRGVLESYCADYYARNNIENPTWQQQIDAQLSFMNYEMHSPEYYNMYNETYSDTYNFINDSSHTLDECIEQFRRDYEQGGFYKARNLVDNDAPGSEDHKKVIRALETIDQFHSPDAAVVAELNTIDTPLPDVNSVFDDNYVINQDAVNVDTSQGPTTVFYNNQGDSPDAYQTEVNPYQNYDNTYYEANNNPSTETIYVDTDYAYEGGYNVQPDNSYVAENSSTGSVTIQQVIALYNGEYGYDEASRRAALGSNYDLVMDQLKQNIMDGHSNPEDMVLY